MRALAIIIFIALIPPVILNISPRIKRGTSNEVLYNCYFIIFFLFAALRPVGIDQDSLGYQGYYNSGKLIWVLVEPSFGVISYYSRLLFNDFRCVLVIYAAIGLGLKFWIMPKLAINLWQTLIIYFSTYFLLHEFTQIRVGIASGLFLIALYYLKSNQSYRYVLCILIAGLFHYSALVLLPVIFFKNFRLNKTSSIIIASLIPLAIILTRYNVAFLPSLNFIETISMKLEIYSKEAENASIRLNIFNLIYISKYLILYVFIYYRELLQVRYKYFDIILVIYAISLFLYISLSWNTILAMRISELLGVVEILLLPCIGKIFKSRSIGALAIIIIAAFYLFANIYSLELIYSSPKL